MLLLGYSDFDGRVWIIPSYGKVLYLECQNVFHVWVEGKCRELTRLSRELLLHSFHLVGIDVGITRRVNELKCLHIQDLRHHHSEDSVACYVKAYA